MIFEVYCHDETEVAQSVYWTALVLFPVESAFFLSPPIPQYNFSFIGAIVLCYSRVQLKCDARKGKWRGNWRMEWVASTLHTTSEHGVSSITTADAHSSAANSRLNWLLADLNGLVRFAERINLVSARVPSHFNWPLLTEKWFSQNTIYSIM